MNRLNRLPELTDQILAGLKADDSQKHRILLSAAESSGTGKKIKYRTVIALCSLSVLLILLCVFASGWTGDRKASDLQNIPAGSRRNESPVNLQTVIDRASDLSQETVP